MRCIVPLTVKDYVFYLYINKILHSFASERLIKYFWTFKAISHNLKKGGIILKFCIKKMINIYLFGGLK